MKISTTKKSLALAIFSLFASASAATELLTNGSFENLGNVFGGWTLVVAGYGNSITYYNNGMYGYDARFHMRTPTDLDSLQLYQSGIAFSPKHKYTIKFGGNTDGDEYDGSAYSRPIAVGLLENDHSTPAWQQTVSFSEDYRDFSFEWTNCSSSATSGFFYIMGGVFNEYTTTGYFKIAYASVVESDTTCPDSTGSNGSIRMNQLGFLSNGAKTAILKNGTDDSIEVRKNSAVVLSVAPSVAQTWALSGETVRSLDFSSVTESGTYALYQKGTKISKDFVITQTPYSNILNASLKFYYYQRASLPLSSTYAGTWSRGEGTPDSVIYLHRSTSGDNTLIGSSMTTISSPGGWYDAGDFGKYIVNSGISTYTLLSLYEHYPSFFASRTWNIPESTNSTPDLLDEIRYNLEWMLTMQASDGGMYHKLTSLSFPGTVLPEDDDTGTRFAIGKSTAATFDFAAVMATASRLYEDFDTTFAAKCLTAAQNAYDWGIANPSVLFTANPSDIQTGEYKDDHVTDEKFWASVEMYLATGNSTYLTNAQSSMESPRTPEWAYVNTLGYYTIASHPDTFGTFAAEASDSLKVLAEKLRAQYQINPYLIAMQSSDYVWGSNAVAANQGVVLLYGYYLTKEASYLSAAQSQLDYLLGRNPKNISYVTGYGTTSPLHPHHRQSQADAVTLPVPGMLVGGPHLGLDDYTAGSCSNYATGYAASTYYDDYCSYATNEVAINWNAPFAYLTGALEALGEGAVVPIANVPTSIHNRPIAQSHLVQNSLNGRLIFNGKSVEIYRENSSGEIKRYDMSGHLLH